MFDKIWTLKEILEAPEEAPIWLVDKLVGVGDACIVFGMYSSGKSYLLTGLALALSNEAPFLDMRVRKSRVMYLDKEMNKTMSTIRTKEILKAHPEFQSDSSFFYVVQPDDMMTPKFGLYLAEVVKEKQIDVVFIDSLRSFLIGNEKEATDIRAFWNALLPLKRMNVTVIVTHHMNKPHAGQDVSLADRASGSTDICAGSDTVLAIEKLTNPPDSLTTKITQIKGRWSYNHPPFKVIMDFTEGIRFGLLS